MDRAVERGYILLMSYFISLFAQWCSGAVLNALIVSHSIADDGSLFQSSITLSEKELALRVVSHPGLISLSL